MNPNDRMAVRGLGYLYSVLSWCKGRASLPASLVFWLGRTLALPYNSHVGTTSVVPYNTSFGFNRLCDSESLRQKKFLKKLTIGLRAVLVGWRRKGNTIRRRG
jgi:hypothetical protein